MTQMNSTVNVVFTLGGPHVFSLWLHKRGLHQFNWESGVQSHPCSDPLFAHHNEAGAGEEP